MLRTNLLVFLLLLWPGFSGFSQSMPNINRVYDPSIKTVQVAKSGFELSAPIIRLHSDEQIRIDFDDLDPEIKRYKFTVLHCESDWSPTTGLDLLEVIDGFREENIDQFEYSYNTTVKYTHFTAFFPTPNMRPRISGNYLLVVYEEDPFRPAFTWRFMVFETSPVVTNGSVVQSSRMEDHLTRQQIDMVVHLNGLSVTDITREIKVIIRQNGRWDNLLKPGRPRFIRGDELDYRYDETIVFDGGNQYRSFDTKSLIYQSERIAKISFDTTNQVFLLPDLPRPFKQYVYDEDLNGQYYVKNEEHAENSSTEADYAWVHFFLPYPSQLTNGQFHILGDLTLGELGPEGQMSYNFTRKGYELNLFLKQGYYNYLYALAGKDKPYGDIAFIEGNHWETENEYTVMVYLHETGTLYDRLIAVNFINSIPK